MMLNNTVLVIAVFSVFFSVLSPAGELSSSQRLRRLSMHLRGIPPLASEYQALSELSEKPPSERAQFFRTRSDEYLASREHRGKMVSRVDELLRLKTSSGLPEGLSETAATDPKLLAPELLNSLDLLVSGLVIENASWDQILLSPTLPVHIGKPVSFNGMTFFGGEIQFLSAVFPDITTKPEGVHTYSLDPTDLRFAGVLTTSRFFQRYSTTNLNKNRGRAAAVFRTFLCDDMRAVVEPSAEEESELLKKAFPENPVPDGYHRSRNYLNGRNRSNSNLADDDLHGSQESCMACHYKLDPMGRAFITSGSTLSDLEAPGALVYKRADGSLVSVKGRGIGEVARAILAQPEYARCQVSHFWRWFIRADKMPPEERMGELMAGFDRVGRRVNDFIGYVVNEPEFYTNDDSNQPTLLNTKALLQRCDSCHSGLSSKTIPSFVQFPIGASQASHEEWILKVVAHLDLAHDGVSRTMPPKESAWQPTADDIALLKIWVSQRVRDESGMQTITQAQANDWLGISGPLELGDRTTFRRSFKRYASGQDVFRVLHAKFPKAPFLQQGDTQTLSVRNRAVFGDPNPFDGQLVFENVSSGFVREFGRSLSYFAGADIEASAESYFGSHVVETLVACGLEKIAKTPKEAAWKDVPKNLVQPILRSLVIRTFDPGLESVKQEFLERSLDRFQSERLQTASVFEALKRMVFMLSLEEEFLAY